MQCCGALNIAGAVHEVFGRARTCPCFILDAFVRSQDLPCKSQNVQRNDLKKLKIFSEPAVISAAKKDFFTNPS
jgi:hypothetical protein